MSDSYLWLNKSKSRFYAINVIKNENEAILLNYKWGSCNSNRGGTKNMIINSEEEVNLTLSKMLKRRKSRGYELISPISS